MFIETLGDYELHQPTSGGKAGTGCNKTGTIQVRLHNLLIKQERYDVAAPTEHPRSRYNAIQRAKTFITKHSEQAAAAPKAIPSVGSWGRLPTYQAKVGTGSSCCVVIKRARKFHVEQRVEFADIEDLRGMCVGMAPKWRPGLIWKIEDDRLFISYN